MEKKFTVIACRWFDRTYGNTYHSVRCIRHKDGAEIAAELQYGHGECYRQTAAELMQESGWLPKKYTKKTSYYYDREHNYPIIWDVSDGLKRDAVANGKL